MFTEQDLKDKGFEKKSDGSWRPKKGNKPVTTYIHKDSIGIIFPIDPRPKPRMTRSDKWRTNPNHKDPKRRERPSVTKYRIFRRQIQNIATGSNYTLPETYHAIFYIPMPKSWSKKKKEEMNGKPHKARKDGDNLIKSVQDCLCKDDAYVWDYRCTKVWSYYGKIEIKPL